MEELNLDLQSLLISSWARMCGSLRTCVIVLNSEQIQSLEVLLLAMLPVALLWWLWIRMLRW
jgi:hypothetical protein